ncbi:YciI family protein (plasmid) [Ensifer sp. D2-11]
MPYVIMFHDDPGVLDRKKELRAVHLEYVNKNAPRIIASGGLFPEEDDFPIGGLIILDTDARQDAIDYIENDPFFLNGIFTHYTVDRWRKFVFDHKRVNA